MGRGYSFVDTEHFMNCKQSCKNDKTIARRIKGYATKSGRYVVSFLTFLLSLQRQINFKLLKRGGHNNTTPYIYSTVVGCVYNDIYYYYKMMYSSVVVICTCIIKRNHCAGCAVTKY